ncbi:MAG: SDR family NAD(P)-dependent oxidoreductase [Alphaproteobacteria bacterium]|nr:SDR family NAD(P)-dependent oxidoreductase [Alphaproteobacteria bacterium]
MNFKSKIVLITGGSSGIGAALAERFKAEGCRVIICGRDETKLAAEAARMGVTAVCCDVSKLEDCKNLLDTVHRDFGGLDILVNCAGVMFQYDLPHAPDGAEKIRTEIEINAIAPVTLTYLALPLLQKSKAAAVVFVSSGLAYAAFAPTPVYSGTKALVHHVAQCLRHQFKAIGIQLFELLPPVTDTPMAAEMNAGAFKKSPPEDVVNDLIKALKAGKFEVSSGQSKQLRLMSRLAPRFLFDRMATALDKK